MLRPWACHQGLPTSRAHVWPRGWGDILQEGPEAQPGPAQPSRAGVLGPGAGPGPPCFTEKGDGGMVADTHGLTGRWSGQGHSGRELPGWDNPRTRRQPCEVTGTLPPPSSAPLAVPGGTGSPNGQMTDVFGGSRAHQGGRADPSPKPAPGGAHLQASPAMKSKMAATSSLFQKSLKYSRATFSSPHSPGS